MKDNLEKVLVTGANGFIGSNLIDFLIKKNLEIFAVERPHQNYKNLTRYINTHDFKLSEVFNEKIQIPTVNEKLIIFECDILNRKLLEKLILKINPKYIFHFAAQPYIVPSWEDPVNTIRINVIGTINIFESIKKLKLDSRVILACTSTEFGTTTQLNRPLNESDPLMAVHPYGISKIAAELLSRQYYLNFGIDSINLRFFNQTGLRRINDAPSDFIRNVAKIDLGLQEPIIKVGNLEPFRDFTDIKDTLEAVWSAATRGVPGETYHVCSGKAIQIREILKIVLSFSEKKIQVIENCSEKLRRIDIDVILGNNSKIYNDLGWKPKIPIQITLRKMFNYWINYYKNLKQTDVLLEIEREKL